MPPDQYLKNEFFRHQRALLTNVPGSNPGSAEIFSLYC